MNSPLLNSLDHSPIIASLEAYNQTMEKALTIQLREIEKRIENLVSAIEAGAMTDSTLNRLHELEAKQKKLLNSLSVEKLKAPTLSKEKSFIT